MKKIYSNNLILFLFSLILIISLFGVYFFLPSEKKTLPYSLPEISSNDSFNSIRSTLKTYSIHLNFFKSNLDIHLNDYYSIKTKYLSSIFSFEFDDIHPSDFKSKLKFKRFQLIHELKDFIFFLDNSIVEFKHIDSVLSTLDYSSSLEFSPFYSNLKKTTFQYSLFYKKKLNDFSSELLDSNIINDL
jgi:hypothetical protein